MVTNINKTNNHLSPQKTEHKIRPQHNALEIKVLGFNSHNTVAAFNQLTGSKTPSSCSITQYGVVGWNLYFTGNMTLFIIGD